MSSFRGYLVGVAVVVGCLGAAGCPDEEDPPGIATARAQMQPLVDAACDWMFGCCSPDELVYQVGTFTADAANCSERLLDALESGQPLGLQQGGLSNGPAEGLLALALSVNGGRVSVNAPAVQACADATAATVCNAAPAEVDPTVTRCVPGGEEEVEVPCDPDEMFIGKQGVGDECAGEFECQPGLRCLDFGTAGICARRGVVDEFCFSDDECATGLICDYAGGTCAEGKLIGEACAFLDPLLPVPGTESVRCADSLACDPTSLLCVGGFCAPGAQCSDMVNDSDCPENYFCSGDLMGILATCQLPGLDGTSCTRNETCASDFCDFNSGTCGALLPDMAACTFSEECASSFCDFNTLVCAPTVGTGEACPAGDNAQCADGYCDFMNGQICAAYATAGGACPNGNECDPEAELSCIDGGCQQAPFSIGTVCVDGSQCQSDVCFMGMCAEGTPIGATCATDDTIADCVVGTFCDTVAGVATGSCVALLRSGQACLRPEQCWGDCSVRYGRLMCDATPAFDLGEVWCDSM